MTFILATALQYHTTLTGNSITVPHHTDWQQHYSTTPHWLATALQYDTDWQQHYSTTPHRLATALQYDTTPTGNSITVRHTPTGNSITVPHHTDWQQHYSTTPHWVGLGVGLSHSLVRRHLPSFFYRTIDWKAGGGGWKCVSMCLSVLKFATLWSVFALDTSMVESTTFSSTFLAALHWYRYCTSLTMCSHPLLTIPSTYRCTAIEMDCARVPAYCFWK